MAIEPHGRGTPPLFGGDFANRTRPPTRQNLPRGPAQSTPKRDDWRRESSDPGITALSAQWERPNRCTLQTAGITCGSIRWNLRHPNRIRSRALQQASRVTVQVGSGS